MYKLVVVDDNPWDREGLCRILDWEGLGIQVVQAFSNGLELLDSFERYKPDIVLTDVVMPVMNGIDLALQLQKVSTGIKIIFVSSYSEFASLKVVGDLASHFYIAKPVITDELQEAVMKVLAAVRRETKA